MIKILHSADWHMDSPFQGRPQSQAQYLRQELRKIPGKVASICREEGCDLMLLSGDLFDCAYTGDSLRIVQQALEEAAVPVFISPGNHDFISPTSPWLTEKWPENVHIFTRQTMEEVYLPDLNCHVYGAAFTSMDCPDLLKGFRAGEGVSIAVLHGDPTHVNSPYCPISQSQVLDSGLTYLALGHIHKGGQFRAGETLCAWPGCAMGRGYDEQGEKGLLITELGEETTARFVSLNTPKFFDLEAAPEDLDKVLPPVGSEDFYRVTLTGESAPLNLAALAEKYSRFPNLELRDRTTAPLDIWKNAGEDSFEGTYFQMLKDAMKDADEKEQERIRLAAKICRQILEGQEVVLP